MIVFIINVNLPYTAISHQRVRDGTFSLCYPRFLHHTFCTAFIIWKISDLCLFNLNLSICQILLYSTEDWIFRFIIEDSTLHICDKTYNPEFDFADYVSVMDMGMFDLSLKTTDGMDLREPLIDLTMSNSMLNIRTCADSCVALMKLIKYLASDGDMQPECPPELDSDSVVRKNFAVWYVVTKMFWTVFCTGLFFTCVC